MKRARTGFMDPHAVGEFFSFWEKSRLIGIVRLRPEERGVCAGIAVHPGLCGRGMDGG